MEISWEKLNILFNSRSGLSVGFALALSTKFLGIAETT